MGAGLDGIAGERAKGTIMPEKKAFYRHNVSLMKYMYELTLHTWSAMDEHGERMLEAMAGESETEVSRSRKFVGELLSSNRKARDEFRAGMDKAFQRFSGLTE